MRTVLFGLALLAAAPAVALAQEPVPGPEGEPSEEFVPARPPEPLWGHLSVGLGVRQIGEDEAGFAMSVETDLQRASWPIGLMFNMNIAIADGPSMYDPWFGTQTTNVEIVDFGIGARKVFHRSGPVQPFLSVGGSVYFAGLDSCEWGTWCSASLDDDVTFGPFADAGLYFTTRGRSVFGFRVRYSVGDVTLLGQEVALDGVDVQVAWGMRF